MIRGWWLEFTLAMTCILLSLVVLVAGLWWDGGDE